MDLDVLEQIRERLRVSTRVGDERIEVAARDDDVVLRGAVASPEEATVAGQLAEQYATSVVNELQVDRGLREGFDQDPMDPEPAFSAEDEVLIVPAADRLALSEWEEAGGDPEADPRDDRAIREEIEEG